MAESYLASSSLYQVIRFPFQNHIGSISVPRVPSRIVYPHHFRICAEHGNEDSSSSLRGRVRRQRPRTHSENPVEKGSATESSAAVSSKVRRRKKSEEVVIADFIQKRLRETFKTIQQQNPNAFDDVNPLHLEDAYEEDSLAEEDDHSIDEIEKGSPETKSGMMVEEDSSDWPVDADIGWGIRASDYFEKHAIKNVVAEDGSEIDWEREMDDGWIQEINCLEWERFAYHPSPLIVLVFERYNQASKNWKTLKELENATQFYWKTKDWLPPRTVKIDMNIEKDLAYALKVKECPQILFLLGHRVIYREQEFRSSDELIKMIAYFYYNAKKPEFLEKNN